MDNTPTPSPIDGTDYLVSRQRSAALLVQPGPHRRPQRGWVVVGYTPRTATGHRRAGEDHPPLGARPKGLGDSPPVPYLSRCWTRPEWSKPPVGCGADHRVRRRRVEGPPVTAVMGSVGEDAQASLGYGATATATATTTATAAAAATATATAATAATATATATASATATATAPATATAAATATATATATAAATATATATATAGACDLHERPDTPNVCPTCRTLQPAARHTGRWWRLTDGTVDDSRHGPCPDEWHACPAAGRLHPTTPSRRTAPCREAL